jgi:hypothetical protein
MRWRRDGAHQLRPVYLALPFHAQAIPTPVIMGHSRVAYLPYMLPHVVLLALTCGSTGSLLVYRAAPAALVGSILLDAILPAGCSGGGRWLLTEEQKRDSVWRYLLWALVPLHLMLLYRGLVVATGSGLVLERLAVTGVVGFATSMFGITAAHELMHRPERSDRMLSMLLMGSLSNVHFRLEHEAHHREVGTSADPFTAVAGEGFYTYFARGMSGGLRTVWLAVDGASAPGSTTPRIRTERLRTLAPVLGMYVLVWVRFGPVGAMFLALVGIIGVTCLAIINYLQHYGVERSVEPAGRAEPVRAWHAWECCALVSNWLLFDMPRHAEHHCEPEGECRHEDTYHLPFGFLLAVWIALTPPLWAALMDERVAHWRAERGAGTTGARWDVEPGRSSRPTSAPAEVRGG